MFCLHFSHNLPIAARPKMVKLELKLKLLSMNCYLSTTLFLKLRMDDGACSNDYSELCMIAVLFFFSLSPALRPLLR